MRLRGKIIAAALVALLVLPLAIACSGGNKTPQLSQPARLRVNSNILSWDAVDNAISYRVRIDNDNGTDTNGQTSFSLANLESGKYNLSVKAVAPDGYADSKWATLGNVQIEAKKILIIDGSDKESSALKSLVQGMGLGVDVRRPANAPTTLNALKAYSEVILMNVSANTLAPGFDDSILSYVEDFGGGLFHVGGDQAYGSEELGTSKLANLLPVLASDFAPPVAATIILDNSDCLDVPMELPAPLGTTTTWELLTDNTTWVVMSQLLKDPEYASMLDENNMLGLVTCGDGAEKVFAPTKMTSSNLTPFTGTIAKGFTGLKKEDGDPDYGRAIATAYTDLIAVDADVGLKHIIIITDGDVGSADQNYDQAIENCVNAGIKVSTMAVGLNREMEVLEDIAEKGGGIAVDAADFDEVDPDEVQGGTIPGPIQAIMELAMDSGIEFTVSPYIPKVNSATAEVLNGVSVNSSTMSPLTGYNATEVKNDNSIVVALKGIYDLPFYVQWSRNNGRVGCIMIDLRNTEDSWSEEFLDSDGGRKLIQNIINVLLYKPAA